MRKARAKASDYCDKSAELRTCGGTVADTCDRDSTRQISAGQRFSPTSLTCPAVKPSYRSSQLVCPGTARESPREGDHTHTCLKCKKLEELRQTDRAAKNPEHVASTHERAQAHGSWEGGQCGGRGDRKAHQGKPKGGGARECEKLEQKHQTTATRVPSCARAEAPWRTRVTGTRRGKFLQVRDSPLRPSRVLR